MIYTDDPVGYARNRLRRRRNDLDRLWAQIIELHDPAYLYRLHNVVYLDMRHFLCPASWTDEGWARHGGKDRLPSQIEAAIREALDAGREVR